MGCHLSLSFCCSIVLVSVAAGSSCVCSFVLLSCSLPPSFSEHFPTFNHHKMLRAHLEFFLAPSLESATSSKSSVFSVIGEWHLETQIWVQDMLVAAEASLCLDPPDGLYMFVYLCNRPTHLYMGLSVNVLRKRIHTDTSVSNPAS